jgi:pyruvate/2-oxoglutarate dehydrogenase complex dihydrolipoamide dehydrogenase (E3) component
MTATERYDAVVVGSGQAGGPLASALAQSGRKTAIVEREHVGGTCINEGCTPTKTMIASGRVAYLARRGADYGVGTGEIAIDMTKIRQRKRDIVDSFRGGSEQRLKETQGLDLLMGEASFTGPHALTVRMNDGTVRSLEAELIFLNTGARPSVPKIDGIETVPYLTSTTVMELDAVPEHLIVLGGGVSGLEFGQLFRRLGSRVTIIQRGAHLLAREDDDVADAVADLLREDGIDIRLNAEAARVRKNGETIELELKSGDVVSGSHLLAAAGRTPNTDKLNLDAAGVETDKRGSIPVNERLETNVTGIYALGDVNGGPAFTHISYDDFRIIRTNVIEGGNAVTTGRLVPYTVFIDPQLGRVGLSERDAADQGRSVRVAKMPMSSVARASEVDESRGFMKALVDRESDQILGCAVLGIEGGELMSMIEIAMMGKLPYTALRDGVFAHPSLSESLNNLFSALGD